MSHIPVFLKKTTPKSTDSEFTSAKEMIIEQLAKFRESSIMEERLKIKALMLELAKPLDSLTVNNFIFDVFQAIDGKKP